MKRRVWSSAVGVVLLTLGGVQAASFDFDGWINWHNEVDSFYFTLAADSGPVEIWTDSFDDGANFDPITALWDQATGNLIAENDDNASIRPLEQTYWDSGIVIDSLTAGNYFFTIAAFDNFAMGDNITDGFRHDAEFPIPIEDWWVDGPGYYHLNFAGVDDVQPQNTPAPAAVLLGTLGAGLVGWMRRRRAL